MIRGGYKMDKVMIHTPKAPQAIGPYSQGIKIGNLLYTSGQIPVDPLTGKVAEGGMVEQTKMTLENLKAVLEAGGSSLHQVIKTMIFIKDMNQFHDVNQVYQDYFKEPYPARSCIEVARLPKDVEVEVEAIAWVDQT
jgi:2-iminobutanoate/2-iminopropanoate deaminase